MPRLTDEFFQGFIAVYFSVFAVACYFSWQFRRRLKKFHPDVWAELGQPSFMRTAALSNRVKFWKFAIIRKQYESVGDAKLNFYGAGMRTGFFAIWIFIVAALVLILTAQYKNGVWNQKVTYHVTPASVPGLILVVGLLLDYFLLFRRLKKHYPLVWEKLGEPWFFSSYTPSSNWRVLKFIWSGRFMKLGDGWISLYAIIYIIFMIAFVGMAIL